MKDTIAAIKSSRHIAQWVEPAQKYVAVTRARYLLKNAVVQKKAMGGGRVVEVAADDPLPDNHGGQRPHCSWILNLGKVTSPQQEAVEGER